jgi:hypothetical protein
MGTSQERTPVAAASESSQKDTPKPKQGKSSAFRQQTQDMLAQTAAFSASLTDVPEDIHNNFEPTPYAEDFAAMPQQLRQLLGENDILGQIGVRQHNALAVPSPTLTVLTQISESQGATANAVRIILTDEARIKLSESLCQQPDTDDQDEPMNDLEITELICQLQTAAGIRFGAHLRYTMASTVLEIAKYNVKEALTYLQVQLPLPERNSVSKAQKPSTAIPLPTVSHNKNKPSQRSGDAPSTSILITSSSDDPEQDEQDDEQEEATYGALPLRTRVDLPNVEAERQALIEDANRLHQEKLIFNQDVIHWQEQRRTAETFSAPATSMENFTAGSYRSQAAETLYNRAIAAGGCITLHEAVEAIAFARDKTTGIVNLDTAFSILTPNIARSKGEGRIQLSQTDKELRALLTRRGTTFGLRDPCKRCGSTHEYVDSLCTSLRHIIGHLCTALPREEEEHRILIKISHNFAPTPLHSPRNYSSSAPAATQVSASASVRALALAKASAQALSSSALAPDHPASSAHLDRPFDMPAYMNAVRGNTEPLIQQKQTKQPLPSPLQIETEIIQARIARATPLQIELDIIAQAQARIRLIPNLKAPLVDLHQAAAKGVERLMAPEKAAKSARSRELQIAAATGSSAELRDSVRIKHEDRSSDDEQDVLQELKPSIACHNMFEPLRKLRTRTKHGHVKNDFIETTSDEENEDDESNEEADSDPDYSPSSSTTPSVNKSHKGTRRLTKSDAEELDAFRRNQSTLTASLIANMLQNSQASQAQITSPAAVKSQQLDAHGRPSREHLTQYDHKTKPPTHGEWDNIDYFMKEYMPLYDKYRATCGTNYFDTIYEGYTPTQKIRISRFLTREINGEVIERSVEYLSGIPNEEFVALMCSTRGYGTTSLTEIALRRIQFPTH